MPEPQHVSSGFLSQEGEITQEPHELRFLREDGSEFEANFLTPCFKRLKTFSMNAWA